MQPSRPSRPSVFKEIAYFSTFPFPPRTEADADADGRTNFLAPIFRDDGFFCRFSGTSHFWRDSPSVCVPPYFPAREGRETFPSPLYVTKTDSHMYCAILSSQKGIISRSQAADYQAVSKIALSPSFRYEERRPEQTFLANMEGGTRSLASVASVIAARLFSADVAKSICHACLPPFLPSFLLLPDPSLPPSLRQIYFLLDGTAEPDIQDLRGPQ